MGMTARVSLPGVDALGDVWYNSSWTYRVKITVQNSKVDEDVTDFPIYVNLNDLPAGFHTNVNQTDARDIRVTTSNRKTELPREVVFYDSAADTGELYFKGDLLDATDVDFYIYYGNSSATEPAVDSTYGRNNVWTGAHRVYHFQNNMTDSAGVQDATDGTTDDIEGAIGRARDFGGSPDFIDIEAINEQSDFSWEVMISPDSVSIADHRLLFFPPVAVTSHDLYSCYLINTNIIVYDGVVSYDTGKDLAAGSWQHLAGRVGVEDGGKADYAVIVDGSASSNSNRRISVTGINNANNHIGDEYAGSYGDHFDGKMDEFRVWGTDKGNTFFSTSQNNLSSPETFYGVGDEETEPVVNIDDFALFADEDNILIKEHARGTINVGNMGTVVHNLGHVPFYATYFDDGSEHRWVYGIGIYNSWESWCGTQDIVFDNDAGGTKTFHYYIFKDQQA